MPFQKGVVHKHKSPGRPKGFKGVARLIAKETRDGAELVEWALAVWRDEERPFAERAAAHAWLSDRGLGRPLQMLELAAHLEMDVVDQRPTLVGFLQHLDGAERAELRRLMLKASGDERSLALRLADGGRPVVDVENGGE